MLKFKFFICLTLLTTLAFSNNGRVPDLSDMNKDGFVDIKDLELFARRITNSDWRDMDWCQWLSENGGTVQYKHYVQLQEFIDTYYNCSGTNDPEDALAIMNENDHPTRLSIGPGGNIYITDSYTGSVFIYNSLLEPLGELKNIGRPLAVCVDYNGSIYVGNNRDGRVEVYNSEGALINIIGEENIRMPNDMVIDENDRLYIADSKSNVIWVYELSGAYITTIHESGLKFPTTLELMYRIDAEGNRSGELFVGDKDNYLIKVYDLNGNLKRSFGGFPTKKGWFKPTWYWQGKFVSIQSISSDDEGNLHILDIYMNRVQIINPDTGAYIGHYGEAGESEGQLNTALDVLVFSPVESFVANYGNRRVETFSF